MTSPEPASDQTSEPARRRGRRARRRRRHHRYLPALPGPGSRLLRAAARGGRRRRRHLVLESLPGRALRLGELHLRLPLLAGAVRGVGVAGALRRAAGDRALPQPRGGPVRPPAPHALRRPRHVGRLRRAGGAAGRSTDERRHRASGRATSWPPPASSPCPTSPTCPAGRTSRASRTTRACGRRRPSTSPASGSPSSAPGRAGCRSSPSSPRRPPR